MNIPWPRRPHSRYESKEFRNEDLFECHHCKQFFPWFKFTKGRNLALHISNYTGDDTYRYMNDDKDRGGRRWACDYCILYDCTNNLILIQNEKK